MNENADNTVNSWLNSQRHCMNIMSGYKQLGIGMAYGGPAGAYWSKYSVDAKIHVVISRTILSFIFFLILFILRISKFG
jgi:hypothetical protein